MTASIGLRQTIALRQRAYRRRRPEVGETVRFLQELLYDTESALRGGGALGGRDGEDQGDRSEGVVDMR
jgi:hypothetical protein